jgi:hypothetical protein
LDSGTSPRDFIVMELVDGVDVAQLLSYSLGLRR